MYAFDEARSCLCGKYTSSASCGLMQTQSFSREEIHRKIKALICRRYRGSITLGTA